MRTRFVGQARGTAGILTVAIVAILALAHPAATLAQDTGDDALQISDLPGVQAAVSRTFTLDFAAMFSAEGTPTPVPAAGTVDLFALGGSIVQFDNEGDAKSAYSTVLDEVSRQQDDEGTPAELTFATIDLGGDLGDERTALRATGDAVGGIAGGDIVALVVRQGNLIVIVTGIANAGDPGDAVVAFARAVIGAKAGSGEATFNEDGTSTGGLWDMFPAAGSPVVAGLPSVLDTDLMTDGSGE
ncbi:MAG: hypothetical protein ACTHQE_14595 [Thermomicrobiales bacterium]